MISIGVVGRQLSVQMVTSLRTRNPWSHDILRPLGLVGIQGALNETPRLSTTRACLRGELDQETANIDERVTYS